MSLKSIARAVEFAGSPAVWRYLRQAGGARSIASYRVCQAVASLVPPLRTIVDVGANQGQFAVAAAWWFPQASIVSFEPAAAVFQQLRRNTARLDRIEAIPSAVGDHSGELDFFEAEYSHASSALAATETQRRLREDTGRGRRTRVPVTTLDEAMRLRQVPAPVLLKLDVQGFERKVLEGARAFLPSVDFLLFECSYRAMYVGEPLFAEMYGFVSSLGYELVAPVGQLDDGNHVILQSDLLWARRVPCA
jgi:FkbM family methyltransferase